MADRWELTEIGAAFDGGSTSFVAPARGRDGRRFVLKVTPVVEGLVAERIALEHWGGSGAVAVEAVAPEAGGILLERAEPGIPLAAAGLDEDEECRVFCEVVRRLQREGGPRDGSAPSLPELPPISSWTEVLQDDTTAPAGPADPIESREPIAATGPTEPREPVDAAGPTEPPELAAVRRRALVVAEPLLDEAERTVLHGDLHHENILAAGPDRWVAIDPKGVVGPPEAEAAAFLRNPRDRLLASGDPVRVLTHRVSLISSGLGFDVGRVSGWAFVLAVVAAMWALEDEGPAEADAWLQCALGLQEVHDAVGDSR